jgi:hypothetical protein
MRQYGVLYDVGRAMGSRSPNWRPDYTPALVRRELQIIHTDLAANAVRLCGRDLTRLLAAAGHAAALGLHVWICPELWNATPRQTLDYLAAAAAAAEPLRERWPDRLTFSVGNELTLFMRGIVPGRNHAQRSKPARLREIVLAGRHTPPLRAFLADAVATVRRSYHGPISYCSLPFEDPDWDLFDIVAVNHYRQAGPAHRYEAVLARLMAIGKPVAITELGFVACRDAENPAFLSTLNATPLSLLGLGVPAVGRLFRPRVRTIQTRDEAAQARLLIDQLEDLDRVGVDSTFVMSFSFPLAPYDEDPRHDLDASTLSIVRALSSGQHGTTFPDMPWEPKQAFHALAEFHRRQQSCRVN